MSIPCKLRADTRLAAEPDTRHSLRSLFHSNERSMPKAYWVSTYRTVNDQDKLAAYAKLAGPALTANGARFLARRWR